MTFIDAYIENRLDARHLPTKDVDWSLGESGKPKVSYFGRFDDVMILKASARLMEGQYDNAIRRQSASPSLTEDLASAIENGTSVLVVRDTDGSQGFLPDTKAITTIKEHAALEYLCELLTLEAMDYMKDITCLTTVSEIMKVLKIRNRKSYDNFSILQNSVRVSRHR